MGSTYWQKDTETADRMQIRSLQETKLERILEYVERRSAFYREKFKRDGVSIRSVSRLRDLKELPFTDREEIFRDQAEHGRLGTAMCTDFTDPGQIIGQTGVRFSNTGKPLRVIVSLTDLANQGKLAARGLISTGVTSNDYLYIAEYPQFNPIYMHVALGSINVRSKCLLVGNERADRNIRIYMKLYPPNAFFISPSYAKFVADLIAKAEQKFRVKTVLGWNEPGYSLPSVRKQIESLWKEISLEEDLKVCDVYGLVEIGLLGFECRHQSGMHGFEDSYIYEIIDPERGNVLGPGEEGELVVTHLEREGMPLIRYRTGDITAIDESPCSCGRTHLRLRGIKGRWAERLEVQGKGLYWSQVDEALARTDSYKGDYNLLTNGVRKLEALEIAVDQDKITPTTLTSVRDDIQKVLGVPVNLKPVPAEELLVYPHRSQRIIDQSQLDVYRKVHEEQIRVEN